MNQKPSYYYTVVEGGLWCGFFTAFSERAIMAAVENLDVERIVDTPGGRQVQMQFYDRVGLPPVFHSLLLPKMRKRWDAFNCRWEDYTGSTEEVVTKSGYVTILTTAEPR